MLALKINDVKNFMNQLLSLERAEILLFFNHTRQITANTVSNRFSAVSGSVFTIICRFFFADFY